MRPRSSPSPHLRLWWNISFSTLGTAPECRLTSKSAPIFVRGSAAQRTNAADSKWIFFLKKKRKKLTGCCVIPPRCSPKTIGVNARRRELFAAPECWIIKRSLSAGPGPALVPSRTLTHASKNTVLHTKNVQPGQD